MIRLSNEKENVIYLLYIYIYIWRKYIFNVIFIIKGNSSSYRIIYFLHENLCVCVYIYICMYECMYVCMDNYVINSKVNIVFKKKKKNSEI